MPILVVLLERGSSNPLYTWHETEELAIQKEKWRQVALDLIRNASEGRFSTVEVFLCVTGEQMSDLLNYKIIKDAIIAARAHTWVSSIYVVVDSSKYYRSALIDHIATLQNWFDEIYKAGATDVIHTGISWFDSISEPDRAKAMMNLGSSASSSRLRQKALRPKAKWRCLLRKEDVFLQSFLDVFETYSEASLPLTLDGNLITILEDSSLITQKRLVDKALISCQHGKHLVALRHPGQVSPYLRQLKDTSGLNIISYRSSFELFYMVQLLNAKWQTISVQRKGDVREVALINPPVFRPLQNFIQPVLLVTNSFDPYADEENCLIAAREADQATRRKPSHTECLVRLSVTCQNLPDLFKSLASPLTVWLHLGHGDELRSPQRWLNCFKAYGGSLPLVVFSTCESITIAEHFAQAGAGVAIGFEKEVPSEACEYLTSEVVGAALNFDGDHHAILQAFHDGCARLEAHGFNDLGQIAFYSQK